MTYVRYCDRLAILVLRICDAVFEDLEVLEKTFLQMILGAEPS